MPAVSPVPKRSTVIVAAVAVAVLVSGAIVTRVTGDGGPRKRDSVERTAPAAAARTRAPACPSGPTLGRSGLDVGFTRDEAGAAAAAVAYATAPQRWLYFTDDEIRAAVGEIATPVAAPRMVEDVVSDVTMAREQLEESPGRVWWLVRPLAYQVEDQGTAQARVSVWVITILAAEQVAAPQTEFITVTVDLAWVDGDWRADSIRDTPGPTPVTGPHDQPWDAEPFDRSLDGFTRLDGEAVQ
jgi:hypothetical protein